VGGQYCDVYGGTRDDNDGSGSDDWILLALWLQPLVITLSHNTNAIPHILQISAVDMQRLSIVRYCWNTYSLSSRWLVTDLFVAAETCLAKPLTSDSRIFWFQYSGFQAARQNIKAGMYLFSVLWERSSLLQKDKYAHSSEWNYLLVGVKFRCLL
jgi:hypothetical protein